LAQTIHIARNLASRWLRNKITRLLPDREYLTPKQFKELCKEYNYCCAYCNTARQKLTKEHVISNSNGGTIERKNIIPVCGKCNDKKIDKDWYEFAKQSKSRFITKIKRQIDGYIPLKPLSEYENHSDPKIREAYENYLSKLISINIKFSKV